MGRKAIHTAALVVMTLGLTAAPSFAQREGRRDGGARRDGGGGRPAAGAQAQPRVAPSAPRQFDQRVAPRTVVPYRGYTARPYYSRPYAYRPYSRPYYYAPYGYRSYVAPFGWRPYGYRPGWSFNLYFGAPYSGYGYGYPAAGYGYYSLVPGRPYGSVRIVDAPRDAKVFVDGYYAGVVDDYDGVFQHLNLDAGSHHIEIEADGYERIGFDVRVEPGQTVTYHANFR